MKTTLNEIRKHNPCKSGWEKLLTYLGKTKADDEEISILAILDSNGLYDALWCLRAVEGRDREIRMFAVWCARQVQHLMTDKRSLDALDVAERYANGQASEDELKDAWYAAEDAARAAAWSAESAAAAAWAAVDVWAAMWGAARAAWNAAEDAAAAARDTSRDASRDAAWSTARAKQEEELRRICMEVQGESGA